MIARPDKVNGVVILDKTFYKEEILKLISDVNKFKKLKKDPTLTREGKLQGFLRKIKDKSLFNDNTYKQIYPSDSKPATIYGLPKLISFFSNDFQDCLFCPIVSSIATYNYNLGKFLSELLDPFIPSEHCAKGSFIFCEKIQGVSAIDYILQSSCKHSTKTETIE